MKYVLFVIIVIILFLVYFRIKAYKVGLKRVINLHYLDENNQTMLVTLSQYKDYLLINQKNIKIPNDSIKEFNIMTKEEFVEKKKSLIGRAIVGGILFGGVGAIVGGMSALKNDTVSKKTYVVEIKYEDKELYFITRSYETYKDLLKVKNDLCG